MSEKIKFLDLSSFNCWIVYLRPNRNDEEDTLLQKKCIQQMVFGMGWPLESNRIRRESACTQELQEIYLTEYQKKYQNTEPENSLNLYAQMKKGDLVIMRLLDGHYYVGKIESDTVYLHGKQQPYKQLSWGCKVEKWHEIRNEADVPSEIIGRFSQKRHATVQRVVGHRLKILIKALFDFCDNPCRKTDMPILTYNQNTFARSLDYTQLEDLVYLYMINQYEPEENYILLPSSCKINQQKYEFRLTHKKENDDITCQVKNQTDLDLDHYTNDPHFRAIYIFCGEWSEQRATAEKERYMDTKIKVILPSELYQTLLDNDWLFNNKFCTSGLNYPSSTELQLHNNSRFVEVKEKQRFHKPYEKTKIGFRYTKDGYIIFDSNWNLFYAPEAGSLIKTTHFSNPEEEQTICDMILCELNR